MQMRSDLKKLEIDGQPDLKKPDIDQRARDGRHQGYTKG